MTRIAAVMVGTDLDRFRDVEANEARLVLAREIATFTQGKGKADIVMLPAGFLTAKNERDVHRKAESLAEIFDRQALLAGVDEPDETEEGSKRALSGKDEEGPDDNDGYHYWAFASKAGHVVDGPWHQRSAKSGQSVSDTTARTVKLGGTKIGILICGELYNHALADSLAVAKPDLVANLCHRSMTRFTKSLHRVAETVDRRVLHVQHVALHAVTVSKWEATSRGASSDPTADWVSYTSGWKNELWAEVKVWKV